MFRINVSEEGRKHRVVNPDAGVRSHGWLPGAHISPRFLAWITPTDAFPSRLHGWKVMTLIQVCRN